MTKALFALGLLACALPAAITSSPAVASVTQPEPITVPSPASGKAQIVFFRPGGFVGSAISCAVSENGTKISSLPPGRFFIVEVEPGRHIYSVSSEATDQVFFDMKPGQTNFVKCHVELGIMAGRPKLDAAQDLEFSSKTWKSVDPSKMGPNVLSDEQIKAASAASAPSAVMPASALVPAEAAAPTAVPAPVVAPSQPTVSAPTAAAPEAGRTS